MEGLVELWQWSVLGVEWSFSSYRKKDHGGEKDVWE